MLEQVGYLFYIVRPSSTYQQDVEQVPSYITQAIPFFVGLIILEQLIALYKGLQLMRLNDAITSAAQGILMEQSKLIIPSFSIAAYVWLYDNYRLVTLSWNSIWVWLLTLILVDFGFYWFHRACHEVNILWASHQAHHSSEFFNLTTALRQSLLQLYFHSIFYLPLALFIPPSVYLVHFEFNTLFQFWIHTELIDDLGPLGYLFNTPSHHRVHHGRNRYCIDKNYGSVFILWDRIFGTFEPERRGKRGEAKTEEAKEEGKSQKVIYGLTHPVRTFNILRLQFEPYLDMWTNVKSHGNVSDKLSVMLHGPGWRPGGPRLGSPGDIPDIDGQDGPADRDALAHYRTEWANMAGLQWQLYCSVHFLLVIVFHVSMAEQCVTISQWVTFLLFAFILLSLTTFGILMDGHSAGPKLELVRLVLFFLLDSLVMPERAPSPCSLSPSLLFLSFASPHCSANLLTFTLIKAIFAASLFYWLFHYAQRTLPWLLSSLLSSLLDLEGRGAKSMVQKAKL